MKSLGDIQRSGMEREETANKKRQEAEAQVTGLERSLVDTKGELTVLKHEKASIAEGLEKAKKDLDAAETSLKGIREQVDGYKSEISSQAADLKLEKELRTRSELKEVEERNERIAVGAQMVAMTKEHAVMQQQLNEANEVLEVKWRKKMEEKEAMVEAREAELVEAQDLITGLEGEIGSLKEALTHQKSAEAAQHAETVSKLNGEIHLLNAKIKAEEEKLPAARAEFAKERLELENQIREGAAERRRMHNTIQELRGNVRVSPEFGRSCRLMTLPTTRCLVSFLRVTPNSSLPPMEMKGRPLPSPLTASLAPFRLRKLYSSRWPNSSRAHWMVTTSLSSRTGRLDLVRLTRCRAAVSDR
jgi:chromosome segregation ATPase